MVKNIAGLYGRDGRTRGDIDNRSNPGPYIATVVSHLDSKFMGSLKVRLNKTMAANSDVDDGQSLITAFYASPFYGVTNYSALGPNDDYRETQQSYGFWAIPPDPGTRVLVMFVEGRADICFWIACIPDDYMNFMIPDGRPATTLVTPGKTGSDQTGRKSPVGEYNKIITDPGGNPAPTTYLKPINNDFAERLTESGLLTDDTRGLTTSSARREAPSAVFGINTPGPLDKRDGARRIRAGTAEHNMDIFSHRLGGHSIVMDDGDANILRRGSARNSPSEYLDVENTNEDANDEMRTLPANELFRIRTRTGHQILLHNTEDLIYISNSRGTAWIELTSNGKIDIYAQDSISMHTENDFNVTADGNINLTAGKGVNINATDSIKQSAGKNLDLLAVGYFAANAAETMSFQSGEFIAASAGTSINMVSAGGSTNILSSESININSGTETSIKSGTAFYADATTNINLNAAVTFNAYGAYGNILIDGSLKITASGEFDLNSSAPLRIVATNLDIKSNGILKLQANTINELSTGEIFRTATTINDLSSSKHILGSTIVYIDSVLNVKENIITPKTVKASFAGPGPYTGSAPPVAAGAGFAIQAEAFGSVGEFVTADPVAPSPAVVAVRVPQHEPWLQHENLDPVAYSRDAGGSAGDTYVESTPDPFSQYSISTSNNPGFENLRDGRNSLDSAGEDEVEENTNAQFNDGDPIPTGSYTKEAIQVIDFFIGKGYTIAQACGFAGAIQQESGVTIEPGAWNNTAGGVGARGIVQWRGAAGRLLTVERFLGKPILIQPEMNVNTPGYAGLKTARLPTSISRKNGFTVGSANASREEQLSAVWQEIQKDDPQTARNRDQFLVDTGNGVNDARQVARLFDDIYLRSQGAGIGFRQDYAEILYRNYIGSATPYIPGTDQTPESSIPADTLAAPAINSKGGVLNVIHNQYAGAVRSLDVKEDWRLMINRAARDSGVSRVDLISARQPEYRQIPPGFIDYSRWFSNPRKKSPGKRIGSERHDTGLAGDIDLYVNNGSNHVIVSSNTLEGKRIMNRFCVAAVRYGARGFGHSDRYMGLTRIHIDMLGQLVKGVGWNRSQIGHWSGTQPWFYQPLITTLNGLLSS